MQQEQGVKISSVFWASFISMFPVIGLTYLIIASCSKEINRRNIARGLLLLRASTAVFGALFIVVTFFLLDKMM